MKNNRSFTLIELLVVIAVLAGFMALLFPNFMGIRVKSRDMKRKSDLKSLQKALELYSQNQTPVRYPTTFPSPCFPLTDANGMVYIQKVPQDPLTQCTDATPANYVYFQPTTTPATPDPNRYYLYACAENKNDSEAVNCPSDFDTRSNSTCSSTKCYQLTEP